MGRIRRSGRSVLAGDEVSSSFAFLNLLPMVCLRGCRAGSGCCGGGCQCGALSGIVPKSGILFSPTSSIQLRTRIVLPGVCLPAVLLACRLAKESRCLAAAGIGVVSGDGDGAMGGVGVGGGGGRDVSGKRPVSVAK